MTFKKTIIIAAIAVMVLCMSACTEEKNGSTESAETAETGLWEINNLHTETVLPDDVEKAFNQAAEKNKNSSYEPVAYIGSQVVSGMNYMILCKSESETQNSKPVYQMAVIYADLNGNAEMTSLADFDFSKYTEGDGAVQQDLRTGGWSAAENAAGSDIPDEAEDAFEKAMSNTDWEWQNVQLLACLGSQSAEGTNYALLCKGVDSSENSEVRIFVLTINENLDGNAEITNVHVLDLSEFTEQEMK